MLDTYYTYLYLRDDGTPYYVGKGKGRRVSRTVGRHRPPFDSSRIILQEFSSEPDAIFAERFLISLYGRKDLSTGCLINMTDGGEGASGRTPTLQQRLKVSQSLVARPRPDAVRRKVSQSHMGLHASEMTKKKMRESQRLRREREKQYAKMD
jgi:hypothetical protein